jgi:hypothetical protein
VRLFWLGVLSLLAAGPLWSNEVYRSVDPNGNVRYSDRPEGNNVEKVLIVVPRGNVSRPVRTARSEPEVASSVAASVASPASNAPAEPSAEERARNCGTARERVERYEVSHRLYRTGPDGEREYLSDAEYAEARARASEEVKRWCN